MLKHISQLASMAEYKKACSGDGKVMSDKPTPFVFFPKFAFSKTSSGPVLLLGSVPGTILSEAKKQGGTCITGKASIKEGKVELEGTSAKVSASAMNAALASVGVSKKVAATSATDDDEEGATSAPKTKFPDPLTAPKVEPTLKTKALGKNYEGEDKKLGWRAQGDKVKAESDQVTTLYADEAMKKQLEIGFDEKGRLIDSSGSRIRDRSIGFVANPETGGGLHQFNPSVPVITPEGKRKNPHHSTPLSGKPVSGAGTIDTGHKGNIKEITDQSGHYKPGGDLTFQTVKAMAKAKDAEGFDKNLTDRREDWDGVPKNKPAKVTLVGKQGLSEEEWKDVKGSPEKINALIAKKFGASVQLSESELNRATFESINISISQHTSVTVTSQQYLQTEGNETAIRGKMDVNKELVSKTNRVRAKDNADGPAPNEPSGMSAADFKKLGGTPIALKNVTKDAKPSTLHTREVAKKLASDANKGRKPAPQQQTEPEDEPQEPDSGETEPTMNASAQSAIEQGSQLPENYMNLNDTANNKPGGYFKPTSQVERLSNYSTPINENKTELEDADEPEPRANTVSSYIGKEDNVVFEPEQNNATKQNTPQGYVSNEEINAQMQTSAKNPNAYKPAKPGKKK